MSDSTAGAGGETGPAPVAATPAIDHEELSRSALGAIYVLFMVNIIPAIIGMVLLNRYKDGVPDWMRSHFQFLEGTFWKGLLFGVVGFVLAAIMIGWIVLLVLVVWWYLRVANGYMALQRGEAIPNPSGWGFGISG